jgi:hypothetical protein
VNPNQMNSFDCSHGMSIHRKLNNPDNIHVTIDNLVNVHSSMAPYSYCFFVSSPITRRVDDNVDKIKTVLEDGILESFATERFYENVPADTVICPWS